MSAGLPPDLLKLACVLSIQSRPPCQSSPPICVSVAHLHLLIPILEQTDRINRRRLALFGATARQNPHSVCRSAAPPPPHYPPPRFRALALFGRRPPERALRSSLPASENPHRTGSRMQEVRFYERAQAIGMRDD